MTCRMLRPFSGILSLTCFGLSSWRQKCIGPSGAWTVPPKKQGRPAVRRKSNTQTMAQTYACWLSVGCFRRRSLPQAAPSSGQPRPIRLVRAGQPHRPCLSTERDTLRRHRSEWREVVVRDVRRARARRHDSHLECLRSSVLISSEL